MNLMQGQLGAKTRLAYSGHPIGTTRGEMWSESKSAPMYLEVEGPHSHHHMYSRSEPSEVSLTGPQADGGAKAGGLQCSQPGLHSEAINLWQSGVRCRTSLLHVSEWSYEAWRNSPTTACRCWPTPRLGMECAAACSTSRPRRMVSVSSRLPGLSPWGRLHRACC